MLDKISQKPIFVRVALNYFTSMFTELYVLLYNFILYYLYIKSNAENLYKSGVRALGSLI